MTPTNTLLPRARAGVTRERGACSAGGPGARRHRFVDALDALARLPALDEVRSHALDLVACERSSREELVATIESDPALVIAVLRAARRAAPGTHASATIPDAINALPAAQLAATLRSVPRYDFFDQSHSLSVHSARMRLHALLVQEATERILDELERGVSNSLRVAAMLHDVGKLLLARLYTTPVDAFDPAVPVERRLRLEREAIGFDHAAAGGVVLRRLGVATEVAKVVEQHHSSDARGDAALIALADLVAHYAVGGPADPASLARAATRAGVEPDVLRRILRNPLQPRRSRRGSLDPCPLSARQLEIIRGLRDGKLYKQIGAQLGMATSTVRSHLHKAYVALGVVDRAQVVLLATERGWI